MPKKRKRKPKKTRKKLRRTAVGRAWRRLKVFLWRVDRRQRRPVAPPTKDETQHACHHCGHEYAGRQCPMCGMPATWQRFTWKQLVKGFLDIWGMGNRPMFRSMGHLMWRPGYMINDYLHGHHLAYFPPFKMLAVLTVLIMLLIWIFGINVESETPADIILNKVLKEHVSGSAIVVVDLLEQVINFFITVR